MGAVLRLFIARVTFHIPGNAKAKTAMEDYHRSFLHSYEKVVANPKEMPSQFVWRELSFLGLERAIENYKKVLELDPKNQSAQTSL